jgi:hypothetical protein
MEICLQMAASFRGTSFGAVIAANNPGLNAGSPPPRTTELHCDGNLLRESRKKFAPFDVQSTLRTLYLRPFVVAGHDFDVIVLKS